MSLTSNLNGIHPMANNICPPPERLLLSAREAAASLGVSQRHVWTLTFKRKPALPHIRAGGRIMYRPADLNAWIESQRRS